MMAHLFKIIIAHYSIHFLINSISLSQLGLHKTLRFCRRFLRKVFIKINKHQFLNFAGHAIAMFAVVLIFTCYSSGTGLSVCCCYIKYGLYKLEVNYVVNFLWFLFTGSLKSENYFKGSFKVKTLSKTALSSKSLWYWFLWKQV